MLSGIPSTFGASQISILEYFFPKTGLALLGFSRSWSSSLDLLDLIPRGLPARSGDWLPPPPAWESGNLEIQEPGHLGNLESTKSKK